MSLAEPQRFKEINADFSNALSRPLATLLRKDPLSVRRATRRLWRGRISARVSELSALALIPDESEFVILRISATPREIFPRIVPHVILILISP